MTTSTAAAKTSPHPQARHPEGTGEDRREGDRSADRQPLVAHPEDRSAEARSGQLVPVAGCSAVQKDGAVQVCAEHKTYASDPHCRNKECTHGIAQCTVHHLVKGGKVEVHTDRRLTLHQQDRPASERACSVTGRLP